MTKEELLKIDPDGMQEILDKIPDFKWSMLTEMLTLNWTIRNFDILMASEDRKIEIMVSSFRGPCQYLSPLSLTGTFKGFDVAECTEGDEQMFEIIDRAEGGIHIKCKQIVITPHRLEV